eukprot:NODE_20982_length_774_cov_3.196291.p1 GENE.NODE_20982_length_774_cov_3.196291~~NODE_20982_length_774_cov_3.196291.p1  ORF type:complete len:195 (+),score=27.06 NODE_20982_length_774_cov_3.196291:124-708(+)
MTVLRKSSRERFVSLRTATANEYDRLAEEWVQLARGTGDGLCGVLPRQDGCYCRCGSCCAAGIAVGICGGAAAAASGGNGDGVCKPPHEGCYYSAEALLRGVAPRGRLPRRAAGKRRRAGGQVARVSPRVLCRRPALDGSSAFNHEWRQRLVISESALRLRVSFWRCLCRMTVFTARALQPGAELRPTMSSSHK